MLDTMTLDQLRALEAVAETGSFTATRSTASRLSIKPSFTISTATRSAAAPVRFPLRVCSMKSLPFSMVNSKSCMSR